MSSVCLHGNDSRPYLSWPAAYNFKGEEHWWDWVNVKYKQQRTKTNQAKDGSGSGSGWQTCVKQEWCSVEQNEQDTHSHKPSVSPWASLCERWLELQKLTTSHTQLGTLLFLALLCTSELNLLLSNILLMAKGESQRDRGTLWRTCYQKLQHLLDLADKAFTCFSC